jgi:HEPN domain-containing protein
MADRNHHKPVGNAPLPLVAEWFDRGREDLETARLILKARGSRAMAALHIHQAAEKYLKGYLVKNGVAPKKTHDLGYLLQSAIPFSAGLRRFEAFCDEVTRYYLQDRYPPGPPASYTLDEIRRTLGTLTDFIDILGK